MLVIKRVFALVVCLALLLGTAWAEPLFEPTQDGIYNYCPDGFVEDGVTHIYYCTNTTNRVVTDYVGYRTSADGVTYSDESIVLENGRKWDDWDTTHTCDPDVVKGKFMLDGVEYQYLMAYLGCRTGNNQNNEIGLAVAQNPEGPFVKTEALNPFVHFERDLSKDEYWDVFQWGVGQASLVSMDKAGQVMLIYTRGDLLGTRLVCEKWDLSDLNDPKPIGGENWKVEVTNSGVVGRDLQQATLLNADFAYEPVSGTLYMVADGAPCYIEGVDEPGEPTFITSNLRILRFSQTLPPENMDQFFIHDITERWHTVQLIGRNDTGYPRNHNAGLLTDPYGWIEAGEDLQVLYSTSLTKQPSNSLWTYRIHQYPISLDE